MDKLKEDSAKALYTKLGRQATEQLLEYYTTNIEHNIVADIKHYIELEKEYLDGLIRKNIDDDYSQTMGYEIDNQRHKQIIDENKTEYIEYKNNIRRKLKDISKLIENVRFPLNFKESRKLIKIAKEEDFLNYLHIVRNVKNGQWILALQYDYSESGNNELKQKYYVFDRPEDIRKLPEEYCLVTFNIIYLEKIE